jgi:hypothetical protein
LLLFSMQKNTEEACLRANGNEPTA